MNKIKQKQLSAFTMAELLMIMIMSGIVLLSVMEGVTMFRKYSYTMTQRIGNNSNFFSTYCRLNDMIAHSDSIKINENGTYEIFYESKIRYVLEAQDSTLIVHIDDFNDTLPIKITRLYATPQKDACGMYEGISIIIMISGGEELLLHFRIEDYMKNEFIIKMTEKEKTYIYEL